MVGEFLQKMCQGRCLLNTKGFCAKLGPGKKKVELCKGYWNPQRKIGVAKHFFEIISLEAQQKC